MGIIPSYDGLSVASFRGIMAAATTCRDFARLRRLGRAGMGYGTLATLQVRAASQLCAWQVSRQSRPATREPRGRLPQTYPRPRLPLATRWRPPPGRRSALPHVFTSNALIARNIADTRTPSPRSSWTAPTAWKRPATGEPTSPGASSKKDIERATAIRPTTATKDRRMDTTGLLATGADEGYSCPWAGFSATPQLGQNFARSS